MLNVIFTRMENQALEAEVHESLQNSQNSNNSATLNDSKASNDGDGKSVKSLKVDDNEVNLKFGRKRGYFWTIKGVMLVKRG